MKELVDLFIDLEKNADSNNPYWFCDADGRRRDFHSHWKADCIRAGIPGFQFKHCRTAYCSWRVEEGVSLPILQRAMIIQRRLRQGNIITGWRMQQRLRYGLKGPFYPIDRVCDHF
jgi:hypothetical protein